MTHCSPFKYFETTREIICLDVMLHARSLLAPPLSSSGVSSAQAEFGGFAQTENGSNSSDGDGPRFSLHARWIHRGPSC